MKKILALLLAAVVAAFIAAPAFAQTQYKYLNLTQYLKLKNYKVTDIVNTISDSSSSKLPTVKAVVDYVAAYGGGGGVGDVTQEALDDSLNAVRDLLAMRATIQALQDSAAALRDEFAAIIYGQQYTYDIALTQTRNSINLPYKGHKVSLDSIQLVGAVTGVSYTLYKTVSGVPTAGTTRTTLSAINADIAALTTGEVNATYQILILFTFLAGAEYGGSVLFAHKL